MTIPTSKTERLISLEEYQKMVDVGILGPKDKVELIRGKILNMSPIGSKHIATVNLINRILSRLLPDDYILQVQSSIAFPSGSQPEPDIALLTFRADFYVEAIPFAESVHLIIEVSDSTLEFDRTTKLQLYAEANIPEYWIVNLKNQQIEVYRQANGKTYQSQTIANTEDTLSILAYPSLKIAARDILL